MAATVHSVATGSHGRGRWVVDNFSCVDFTAGRVETSPVLHMGERNWTLRLYAGGEAGKDGPPRTESNDFALYLRLEAGQSEVKARFLLTTSPLQFSFTSAEAFTFVGATAWGAETTNASWKTQRVQLPNDRLVIDVEVHIGGPLLAPCVPMTGTAATTTPPLLASRPSHGLCGFAGLSRDLGVLYNTAAGSDVSLLVDGHEYRCHRLVLAARSPVFKAMFASEMKESLSGEVVVEEAQSLAFREFLRFLYMGDCDFSPEPPPVVPTRAARRSRAAAARADDEDNVTEGKEERHTTATTPKKGPDVDFVTSLLRLADQYQVDDLVRLCARHLIAALNVSNVLALLRLSDHCAELQNACLDLLGRDSRVYTEATRDEAAFKALSAEQLRMLLAAIGPRQDPSNEERNKKRPPAVPLPVVADDDDDPPLPLRKRGRLNDNVPTQEDFNHMPVPALKAELRRRKASVDGNRTTLLLRLIALLTD